MRASLTVLVIVPNAVLWMFACGGPKFGWLSALKISPRNIRYCRPNVANRLLDRQIDVPVAGRAQDADARIAELRRAAPRRTPTDRSTARASGSSTSPLPIRLGRSVEREACSDGFELSSTVIG